MLPRYERIVFEKDLIAPPGQPLAAFVCPGHPLLDATLDLMLERHRDLLRRGTVLVDERDPGTSPRVLFYLEHAINDAGGVRAGGRGVGMPGASEPGPGESAGARTISRRMLYVEIDAAGEARHIHYAPFLDYRPLGKDEPGIDAILARPECGWITRELEQKALGHAVEHMVPEHMSEVRDRRLGWIEKTRAAVKDRLSKEINHWDHRAEELKLREQAGKPSFRLNSLEARRRADELQARLDRRLAELKREAQIAALPPVVLGGLVVVPIGTRRCDDRQAVAAGRGIGRHAGLGCAGARDRDGDRARSWMRAGGSRAREARLRYREPGPEDGQAALHRGQGSREWCANDHGDEERDPLLAECAGGFHSGDRGVWGGWLRRRRTHRVGLRLAHTVCTTFASP